MTREEKFLEKLFNKYYRSKGSTIFAPSMIEKREFAFIFFGKEGMLRHVSYRSVEELKGFISTHTPKHVYYSSAYYKYPSMDSMDEKIWEGADLVFDIDADHIPTDCKEEHDFWICTSCNLSGKGTPPSKCPKCGNEKLDSLKWICNKCLDAAKSEVEKLLDILLDDLGFKEQEIKVFFSGHRGFHIHVESEYVRDLGQDARREIIDYIEGRGLDIKLFRRGDVLDIGPDRSGWRKRLFQFLIEFLSEEEDPLTLSNKVGISKRSAERVIRVKEDLLKVILSNPVEWRVIVRSLGERTFERIVNYVVNRNVPSIDERVTIDTKRLIRLPGSLHGKTGFKVQAVDFSNIWDFNPVEHACVFPDYEISLKLKRPVPSQIFGVTLDSKKERIKVPLYLAVYLLGNGGATLD